MKKVYLITGNKEKLLIAQMLFKDSGIEILQKKLDCPEIQHTDVREIAKFSAKWAAEQVNAPVIKNDCGFEIEALNGFPGTFVAYVERCIGEDGFLKIMEGVDNRQAKYVSATAFCEPGKEPVVFTSETLGTIACKKSGIHGWGLDKIFIVKGDINPMGEYDDKERIKLFNNMPWKELVQYLKKNVPHKGSTTKKN